jgi:hypothetical protein
MQQYRHIVAQARLLCGAGSATIRSIEQAGSRHS